VDPREEFCSRLALLTGQAPFPWQQRLYDEFQDPFRAQTSRYAPRPISLACT